VVGGWHKVGFSRDFEAPLTPVDIGRKRLMLVDDGESIRAFDATCPHRGAHLAYGGTLDEDVVVCPFHGRRIGLGEAGAAPLGVAEHPVLDYGGSVYVLPDGENDTGLPEYLAGLAETHCFVPAFTLDAPVPPELVIENAFDTDHFTAVHGISNRPHMEVSEGPDSRLEVRAEFEMLAARPWGGQSDGATTAVRTSFLARAFSPGLVATDVGDPDRPHVVITGAVARADGGSTVRVTLAVWDDGEPGGPDHATTMALARDSRLAFEQDLEIWEHLDVAATNHLDEIDEPVRRFREFCSAFSG
jgi:phenylpropionate dioxygenase-like ring-hydroxylating dioxygenase large terminal subunit